MDERKILLVDDDADLVMRLATRLRAAAYQVISASDAIMALTVARNERPDVVVVDVSLPGGSGLSFLGRLRAISSVSTTPVIVLSGEAVEEKEALEAGAQAYLRKPLDEDALLERISRLT